MFSGGPAPSGQPVLEIAVPKPAVPFHLDAAQLPLDDLHRQHPFGDRLIGMIAPS